MHANGDGIKLPNVVLHNPDLPPDISGVIQSQQITCSICRYSTQWKVEKCLQNLSWEIRTERYIWENQAEIKCEY